jgi:crossover junction endodeoxyribonuclease RuvC
MKGNKMLIIGIDPGRSMGYAVIDVLRDGTLSLLDFGTWIHKKGDYDDGLCLLADRLDKNIPKWNQKNPQGIAGIVVESGYVGPNKLDSLKTAELRGMVKAVAFIHDIFFSEITPYEAKKTISGNTKADKKMMIASAKKLFNIKEDIDDNVADAIAVALAHINKVKDK